MDYFIRAAVLLVAISYCCCTLSTVRDLIQFNVFGIPTLHKEQSWSFDPNVGVRRSRQYQELNGRHGEKAIERLGLGIDGRDLERLEVQRQRDRRLLRGVNFPSSDGDDDRSHPWLKLIKHINNFYLDALHAIFKEKCYTRDPKKFDLNIGLTKEEFVAGINEIFGTEKPDYTNQAIAVFNEIEQDESGSITWGQFLCFLTKHLRPAFEKHLELGEPFISNSPHAKRETIVKLVCIETAKYFCYAIISKHGCVGLYDGNVNFLTSYSVIIAREDIPRTDEERRRKNRWVTDAVFLQNVLMFVVTNTARSIIIYDASGLTHAPLWLILGVPNILTCLTYREDPAILYAGNECGELLSFKFLQVNVGLLRKKHNDRLSLFYWQELKHEKDHLVIKKHEKFCSEGVNHIQYFPHNNTIAISSRDPEKSLIIKQMDNKIQSYVFKMKWGTNCFYLSKKLQIIVTGSEDGALRIWNIVLTSKPTAILKSHNCGIVDVVVIDNLDTILSCSRDGEFKVWSLKEERCTQAFRLKFPPFKIKGTTIAWGIRSIYPGPKRHPLPKTTNVILGDAFERSNILVACCNYVASIKLTFLDDKERNLEMGILPPPPLQNSVLIPTTWKVGSEVNYETGTKVVDDKLEKYMESLKFIIEREFQSEDGLNSDINFKIATLESKKLEMRDKVSQCVPYLALDLQDVEEIKLSTGLPVPNLKKTQALVEKTHRLLSAASYKSLVFSEAPTSSRSRSSRSSVIEFD